MQKYKGKVKFVSNTGQLALVEQVALQQAKSVSNAILGISTSTGQLSFINTVKGMIKEGSVDITIGSAATAGYQEITNSAGTKTFPSATVPAIPTEDYNLNVTVDGILYQITIPVTNTATWAQIATATQVALRAATGQTETVAIFGDNIRITSSTEGIDSNIIIAAGITTYGGGDLLAAIDAVSGYTPVLATPVGGLPQNASQGSSIGSDTSLATSSGLTLVIASSTGAVVAGGVVTIDSIAYDGTTGAYGWLHGTGVSTVDPSIVNYFTGEVTYVAKTSLGDAGTAAKISYDCVVEDADPEKISIIRGDFSNVSVDDIIYYYYSTTAEAEVVVERAAK